MSDSVIKTLMAAPDQTLELLGSPPTLIVSHYFPDLFIVTGVSALETFSLSGSVRQKHIDFSGNVPTVITSAAKYCPPPDFY